MAIMNSDLVLANAFFTTKREKLSIDELWDYYDYVDKKMNAIGKDVLDDFSIEEFLYYYEYGFDMCDDDYYIQVKDAFFKNCLKRDDIFDSKVWNRFYRMGLPKYVVKILDEAGRNFKPRNCDNCCYGSYVINELGENLYCDFNKWQPVMVDPDFCCSEHIFMDENACKDGEDEAKKGRQFIKKEDN